MSRSPEPPVTPVGNSRLRAWFWIVPALTFAVGLLLGRILVGAPGDPSGDEAVTGRGPAATAPAVPAASPGDRTVVVPASCEQGLQRARAALSTVGDTVDAARNLEAARLQRLLDRLQEAQQEVERLADQCRTQVRQRN